MDRKELIEQLRKSIVGKGQDFSFLGNVKIQEIIEMLRTDGDRILSLQNRVSESEAESVELKRRVNSMSADMKLRTEELAKARRDAIDGDNSEAVENMKKLIHDFQLRVDSACACLSEVSAERDRLKKIADAADRWRDLARNRGGQIEYLLKELDKYKALASGEGNTTVILNASAAWTEAEQKLADVVRERDDLRSALAKAYEERDCYKELASGMKPDRDFLTERVRALADMVVWYGMELARHGVYSVTEDEDVIAAYNRKYNAHKTDAVLFRRGM